MLTFNPIYIVWTLAIVSLVSAIWHIVHMQAANPPQITSWKTLLTLTFIAAVSNVPHWQHPFHGLEYEDAYVYNACARGFLYLKDFSVAPFIVQGCAVGSLQDWQFSSAYSGHLVTFPVLLYGYYAAFGFNPTAILYINAFLAVATVSALYLLALQILPIKSYALASSLIFALTPAVSLYHASGFSEVLSSLLITLYLLLFSLVYSDQDMKSPKRAGPWLWIALLGTLFLAVFAKRENILLLFVPTLAAVASCDMQTLSLRLRRWSILLIAAVAILILEWYAVDLQSTNRAEMSDALGAPFRLSYFSQLLPALIIALLRPSWFFVFSYLLVAGVILTVGKYWANRVLLAVLGLWVCYTGAYLFHYRSFFFVRGDVLRATEMLRYITNFYPLFCLIAALPVYLLWTRLRPLLETRRLMRGTITTILVVIGVGLVVQGHRLKSAAGLLEEETHTRPALTTIGLLKEHDILVTDEPLLYQIYADASFEVIELRTLPVHFSAVSFKELVKNRNVYYIRRLDLLGGAPDQRMEAARKILAACEWTRIRGEPSTFDLVALH